MRLGKTVALDGASGACTQRCLRAQHVETMRFDTWNYKISVRWYERVLDNGNGNGERLEFLRGVVEIHLINSTELRLADFDMKNTTDASPPGLSAAASPRSGAVSEATAGEVGGSGDCFVWRLPALVEERGLRWCR
jgi:hypothetical protein